MLIVRHISESFDYDILIQMFSAAKAIDRYIQMRAVEQSSSKEKIDLDPHLQSMIEGIFNHQENGLRP
jgi:hypothetical protein